MTPPSRCMMVLHCHRGESPPAGCDCLRITNVKSYRVVTDRRASRFQLTVLDHRQNRKLLCCCCSETLQTFQCRLWNKRRGSNASLSVLVLHNSRRFVFLLDKTAAPKVHFCLQQTSRIVARHLTAHTQCHKSLIN